MNVDAQPTNPAVSTAASRTAPTTVRGGSSSRYGSAVFVLIAPFLLLFLIFEVLPILYAVLQSLQSTKRSGLGLGPATTKFVWLDNFNRAVHDTDLIQGVLRMLLFGVVQVPVMLGLALVMALIFDGGMRRMRNFFQLSAFLPYAVPGVIGSIIWAFLYVPGVSPIVDLLNTLHLPSDFLGPNTVLWSTANITTWQWTGYNMLIIFAALQALPADLTEAAKMDGASQRVINWRIKVPLIRPALILTAIFSIIGTLQIFSEPAVLRTLTNNVTSTYTPSMAAYAAAFVNHDPNYAAAIAVSLAIATFVLSFGFLRLVQEREES